MGQFEITDYDIRQVLVDAKPLICVDRETQKIVWSNQLAEQLFGVRIAKGLIGREFTELIPEELRERHIPHWESFWNNPERRLMAGRLLPCQKLDSPEKFEANLVLTPANICGKIMCVVGFIPNVA